MNLDFRDLGYEFGFSGFGIGIWDWVWKIWDLKLSLRNSGFVIGIWVPNADLWVSEAQKRKWAHICDRKRRRRFKEVLKIWKKTSCFNIFLIIFDPEKDDEEEDDEDDEGDEEDEDDEDGEEEDSVEAEKGYRLRRNRAEPER